MPHVSKGENTVGAGFNLHGGKLWLHWKCSMTTLMLQMFSAFPRSRLRSWPASAVGCSKKREEGERGIGAPQKAIKYSRFSALNWAKPLNLQSGLPGAARQLLAWLFSIYLCWCPWWMVWHEDSKEALNPLWITASTAWWCFLSSVCPRCPSEGREDPGRQNSMPLGSSALAYAGTGVRAGAWWKHSPSTALGARGGTGAA